MASPIVVTCPGCEKQLKVPAEARGKKLRCKCGHVFVAEAAVSEKPQPAPAPAKSSSAADAEGGNYGLADEESSVPRCPNCAHELESADARICLQCGYDTRTRQRIGTKKVAITTAGDRTMWLLPGVGAVAGILVLIVLDLVYCLVLPRWLNKDGDWYWVTYGGFRVWVVIVTLFIMAYLGKFAVQRLILNPTPPEQEVH